MTFRTRPFSICSAVFVVALIPTLSYAQEEAVAAATHAGEVGEAAVSLKLVSEFRDLEEVFSYDKTLQQLNFHSLPADEKAAAEKIFNAAQKKGANIGETAEQIAIKLKSMGAKLPTLASAGDAADPRIAKWLREPLNDSSMGYYLSDASKHGTLKPKYDGKLFSQIRKDPEFLAAYDKEAQKLLAENVPLSEREKLLSKFAAEQVYVPKNGASP